MDEQFDQAQSGDGRLGRVASQIASALVLALVAAALWELAKWISGTDDIKMPHVWSILAYFGTTTSQDEPYSIFMLRNVWSTAKASLTGLVLGVGFGMLTGIAIARSRLIGHGLTPLVVAAQAVPAESRELFHTIGASKRTVLFGLEIPFALPLIFVGLETAAAFSVVGAIVAELPFGQPDGLGVVILTSWQFYIFQPEALYCVALAACALGAVFVLAIRSIAYFSLGSRSQGEVL